MKSNTAKFEKGLLFFTVAYFLFTSVNINSALGLTYVAFALASGLFILFDSHRDITFRKENDTLFGALATGALSYVVLILASSYIIIPGVNKVLQLLSSTTPVLASNIFFQKLTFGVGVPIVETTFFFAVALDFLASTFNAEVRRESITKMKTWLLIIGLSLAFLFFHLTSKGISDVSTLVIVFFMAVISLVITVWRESYEAAIYFHIIANMSALLFVVNST